MVSSLWLVVSSRGGLAVSYLRLATFYLLLATRCSLLAAERLQLVSLRSLGGGIDVDATGFEPVTFTMST